MMGHKICFNAEINAYDPFIIPSYLEHWYHQVQCILSDGSYLQKEEVSLRRKIDCLVMNPSRIFS